MQQYRIEGVDTRHAMRGGGRGASCAMRGWRRPRARAPSAAHLNTSTSGGLSSASMATRLSTLVLSWLSYVSGDTAGAHAFNPVPATPTPPDVLCASAIVPMATTDARLRRLYRAGWTQAYDVLHRALASRLSSACCQHLKDCCIGS